MKLPNCKFFPNAVVYNREQDYHLIRSACGPAYNHFTGSNKMQCSNVGIVAKCSEGHEMVYLTSELEKFSSKSCVKCRVCGRVIFFKDEKLCCLKDPDTCKKQF